MMPSPLVDFGASCLPSSRYFDSPDQISAITARHFQIIQRGRFLFITHCSLIIFHEYCWLSISINMASAGL
jgi:hypothetical protein